MKNKLRFNKHNTVLRGFTIIELLVAMTLTSLLTIFAFNAYQIIVQQYHAYRQLNQQLYEQQHFYTLLQREVKHAQQIRVHDNYLLFDYRDQHAKKYYFQDDFIYTLNQREEVWSSDTLAIQVKLTVTNWQNNPVVDGKIDEFHLKVMGLGTTEDLVFTKQYAALTHLEYGN